MDLTQFLSALDSTLGNIGFNDTMMVIDSIYEFTETAFKNGHQFNQAGENSGSCKLFAFAKLHHLNETQTLLCFGQYYRGVLNTPEGSDHQNIRNFINSGWEGLSFTQAPLTPKR